ncbi:MAG TPA: hypothetical protein ENH21_07525 [Chromatiales bacterium]|nr:hypothetical protein [Chromatiales bacterium]HEX23265.1 hypothetical protein [Chromatiales bacterium]
MNKQNQSEQQEKRADPSVAEGVSDVINAAFGVGAAIVKTLAEVTAAGKPVTRPDTLQGPLGEMVHYGVTTLTNVIGLVVSVVGGAASGTTGSKPTKNTSANAPASEATDTREKDNTAPNLPKVHQGETLRIPLSMENPADQPMENLVFACQDMRGTRIGAGQPLTEAALRFQPECLDIAPKDFEKLTLFINTDTQTAPGDYVAHIGVDNGDLEIKVEFEVLPGEVPANEKDS